MIALVLVLATAAPVPPFNGEVVELSDEVRNAMQGTTMHVGCPVGFDDLRELRVDYWTAERLVVQGTVIIHKDVARDVLRAFELMYAIQFPLTRVAPARDFGGDDMLAMKANNTSAFNCRPITGRPGSWSKHAYGRAIDINPLINPYVRGTRVLPEEGRAYLPPNPATPGTITAGEGLVTFFEKRGWTWGGRWKSPKDYQHFEKGRPRARP